MLVFGDDGEAEVSARVALSVMWPCLWIRGWVNVPGSPMLRDRLKSPPMPRVVICEHSYDL
jgi:hypothetical protein